MDETCKRKAAFTCRYGIFQFEVMPFGLMNSQAMFQRIMDRILLNAANLRFYLDKLVILSKKLRWIRFNWRVNLKSWKKIGWDWESKTVFHRSYHWWKSSQPWRTWDGKGERRDYTNYSKGTSIVPRDQFILSPVDARIQNGSQIKEWENVGQDQGRLDRGHADRMRVTDHEAKLSAVSPIQHLWQAIRGMYRCFKQSSLCCSCLSW